MIQPIAFFVPTMHGGGAERVVLNLIEGMIPQKIPLDLILASAEGPYLNQIPPEVRLIDLKGGRVIKSVLPLVRYLRTNRPQVVISHMSHTNVIALLAAKLSLVNTPIITVEHNTQSVRISPLQRAKLVLPLMKLLYPQAEVNVAVSQDAAKDLERVLKLPLGRVKAIYNPIVDSQLLAKAEENIEHPWFQDKSTPVFLAVGRLTQQKDFFNLIKAFARVRQQIDAKLVILGEGELRGKLTALIKKLALVNAVDLAGFTANPYAYMKRASAFVLSSRWEGLPTVLVEAMACGCPVIATDCPSGPREILANGKFGTLVPINDAEKLASAMLVVLNDPVAKEYLIERANDFSFHHSVTEYINLIQKVVN